MDEKKSLEIITGMIEQAKGNIGKNSVYYLLWGWLGMGASMGQYVLMQLDFAHHYLPWVILMPLGGIVAAILGARSAKSGAAGYTDRIMGYLWMAFSITLLIVLANGFKMTWHISYSMLIALIGLATFVSGGVLRFTPLKIGGWFAWALTGVALYTNLEISVLCIAATMLVSYLIPGYMLKQKVKDGNA